MKESLPPCCKLPLPPNLPPNNIFILQSRKNETFHHVPRLFIIIQIPSKRIIDLLLFRALERCYSPLVTETDVRYKLGLRESNLTVYPESFRDVKNITGRRRGESETRAKRGRKLRRHATRVTRAKLVTRQVSVYNHRRVSLVG